MAWEADSDVSETSIAQEGEEEEEEEEDRESLGGGRSNPFIDNEVDEDADTEMEDDSAGEQEDARLALTCFSAACSSSIGIWSSMWVVLELLELTRRMGGSDGEAVGDEDEVEEDEEEDEEDEEADGSIRGKTTCCIS